MKIRTDFVTNSSSSSFCTVKIHGDNANLNMDLDCLSFNTFWFHDPESMLAQSKNIEDLFDAILFSVGGDETNIRTDYLKNQLETISDISSLDSISIDCHEEIDDRSWGDPWPRDVSYVYDFKNKMKRYETSISWRTYRGNGDALPPVVKDLSGNALPFLVDHFKDRLCIFECQTSEPIVEVPEFVMVNGEEQIVRGLADKCFAKSKTLETIVLPESIDYIAPNAFYGCKKRLKEVCFKGHEHDDPSFVLDGQKLLLTLFSGKELRIPESIIDFGEFAFGGAWNLDTIVLHDGMKKPSKAALSSCASLKTVKLSDGCKIDVSVDSAKKCFTVTKGVVGFNYKKFAECMIEEENAKEFEKAVKAGDLSAVDLKELYDIVKPKRKPVYKEIKDFLVSLGAEKKLEDSDKEKYEQQQEKRKAKKPTISELKKDKRYKDWEFKLSSDKQSIVLAKYKGKDENLDIPADIGGLLVIELERYSFYCPTVKTISIPKTLERMDPNIFLGCENLESINVDPENKNFLSIDGILYDKDATQLLMVPRSATKLTIPSTVKKIHKGALGHLRFLDTIEVEADSRSFVSIDGILYNKKLNKAIFASNSIRTAALPITITSIDQNCFSDCKELESINLPDSLCTLGDSAFVFCESLTEVAIPGSVKRLSNCVFDCCSSLHKVVLHDGLESIGWRAFAGCCSLRELAIPKSVLSVDPYAFLDCDNLRIDQESSC